MTQLILNNEIYLPQTSGGKYKCYPSQLGVNVDMISGRRVMEKRGVVWVIEYAYDYMGNELMRKVNAVLRSQRSFPVVFLPDDSDEMQSSVFLTESYPQPTFAFSRNGVGLWHDVSFTLREVSPHA